MLFLLMGLLATLIVLPKDYFDEGQSLCLSVLLANTECYACGMTRAIQHMIHLDFSTAWEFNKLSFIVAPLFAFMFGKHFYDVFKR